MWTSVTWPIGNIQFPLFSLLKSKAHVKIKTAYENKDS